MPKLCSKDCTLLLIPSFFIQNRSKQYVEGKLWRVQRRSCGADGSHEGQIIAKSGAMSSELTRSISELNPPICVAQIAKEWPISGQMSLVFVLSVSFRERSELCRACKNHVQ